MDNKIICQSCSMPLQIPDLSGTEKDGSRNADYCIYCYENGQFTKPNMTLENMKTHVGALMEKMKLDSSLINNAVNSLHKLKRWRNGGNLS